MENYEVEEWIGGGSYGSVHRIRRRADKQLLVWKEINYRSMSELEKKMIVTEVNILQELRHPFIVRYMDRVIDKSTARLCIVMEHCAGGDLAQLIKRYKQQGKRFDEKFVWQLLTQLLVGLQYIHTHSKQTILHRDIKPANIFLDEQRNAKLGDFGMARQLSPQTRLAQTSVGTPVYMSPELINEQEYDERSDIWSLGCVLYEMCALEPPFHASDQESLALKINGDLLRRIPSHYSDQLNLVIHAMLQRDRTVRPRVQELLALGESDPLVGMRLGGCLFKALSYVNAYERKLTEHRAKHKLSDAQKREEALQKREHELESREHAMESYRRQLHHREASLAEQIHQLEEKEKHLRETERRLVEKATSLQDQRVRSTHGLHQKRAVAAPQIFCDEQIYDENQPPPVPVSSLTANPVKVVKRQRLGLRQAGTDGKVDRMSVEAPKPAFHHNQQSDPPAMPAFGRIYVE